MDEAGKIFQLLAAVAVAGGMGYFIVGLVRLTLRRLERRAGLPPESEQEWKQLEARLDELEQVADRLTDLEERVDFTERVLAQQREADRLPPAR